MNNVVSLEAYRARRLATLPKTAAPELPARTAGTRQRVAPQQPQTRLLPSSAIGCDVDDQTFEEMAALGAEDEAYREQMAAIRGEMEETSVNWERSDDAGWFYSDED